MGVRIESDREEGRRSQGSNSPSKMPFSFLSLCRSRERSSNGTAREEGLYLPLYQRGSVIFADLSDDR